MHSICVVVSCIHHKPHCEQALKLFCMYCTYTGVEGCWKRLIPILVVMATVMYFLIAIVWILAFTTYTQGKFDMHLIYKIHSHFNNIEQLYSLCITHSVVLIDLFHVHINYNCIQNEHYNFSACCILSTHTYMYV